MGLRFLLYFAAGLFLSGVFMTDGTLIGVSILPFALFWLSVLFKVTAPALNLEFPKTELLANQEYSLALTAEKRSAAHFVCINYPSSVLTIDYNTLYFEQDIHKDIQLSFNSDTRLWPAMHSLSSNALAWLWCEHTHKVAHNVVVKPQIHSAPRMGLYAKNTRGFAGPIMSKNSGTGIELAGISEYQAGKSLRHINWRASAKHEERLLINEFVLEQMTDISFLVDARTSTHNNEFEPLFDYSKAAVMALAKAFDRDGHKLSFHVFGKEWSQQRGGGGLNMLARLEQLLAGVDVGNSKLWPELSKYVNKIVPIGQMIVLVSPIAHEDLPLYRSIRALGYPCLVISPNEVSLSRKWVNESRGDMSQIRLDLLMAQRKMRLKPIEKLSFPILDWHIETPLNQAVLAFQPSLRSWQRQLRKGA